MRVLCFILALFCILFEVNAQDTLKANKEQLIGEYYNSGITFRETKKDSSYFYFEKAFDYSLELKNYSDALELLISSMLTSGRHYDLQKFELLLEKMGSILENDSIRAQVEDVDYYDNRLNYERANYAYKLKNYGTAKLRFKELYRSLTKKQPDSLDFYEMEWLVNTTNFLALIYMNTGKYELSESYFDRSLVFVQESAGEKTKKLERSTQHLLSKLYTLTGRYRKADSTLFKVLEGFKKNYSEDKSYKNSVVAAYQKLIENNIARDSLQLALIQLNESQDYLLAEDSFIKESQWLYGDIYLKLGDLSRAEESYKNGLDLYVSFRQGKEHQDVAKAYGKLALLFMEKGDHDLGLEYVRSALKNSGNSMDLISLDDNPPPENVFSKRQLLHLLDTKMRLLSLAHKSTGEVTYLSAALNTNRDILKTFDFLKSEFDSKLDKQFLAEKAYPIFHRMLETAYAAYQKEPSTETLQLALNIAEKNKDFILLEALRSAQANRYGNVPAKVLAREAGLRAEIAHVEKRIFDATESDSGFSDELFQLKQEYYGFLDTVKTNYPKYHNLKYRTSFLNLDTVRDKLLKDHGTLVSYTMTDNWLYAIVLNGSKEHFLKLPFTDGDSEAVRNFNKLLSSPSIGEFQRKIADAGERIYDKILKKPLQGLEGENLTIIPDGVLHYLPFDLLSKNKSYLLNTTNIGYGNSLASLLELKGQKSGMKNRVLAVAPSFTDAVALNTDRQFGRLLYNDDEVAKISASYDTETVMDHQATLTNFRARTPGFNVLHLATHASANDEYPDYSYLAFTAVRDSTESNILYTKDLYNTSLNADMVTLSACQTGIGRLRKGQGMLSLSKGFYYAGAKSLVNTLWKINDKSTVKLMEYFYMGLSEGKSKTEALRYAKLKYLETTDDDLLRHPYYWAAFVVSGDVSPLNETNYWWYTGAGLLFLVVMFLISRRNDKARGVRRIVLRTNS